MADELSPEAIAELNEHAIPSGTAGLAKHRQPLPQAPRRPDTMLINGEPPRPDERHIDAAGQVWVGDHPVGPHSEPVAYTPPKYGAPPGVNPVKWRAMSRRARRDHLRSLARTMNRVAHQPKPEQ